jgi:nucleoside phosphorylase
VTNCSTVKTFTRFGLTRFRRTTVIGLAASALVTCVASTASTAGAAAAHCTPLTLVLSAMPVELSPLVARASAVTDRIVGDRHYYLGTLQGQHVALELTGIGPVNADATTRQAVHDFRCGSSSAIKDIVFSGVAGGDYIGDVTVATRWTLDAGKHFIAADSGLLAIARRVAAHPPTLMTTAPAGDPACGCVTSPDAVTTVSVTHQPKVEVGGKGQTTDPFGGRALPCAPGGGDVFGCEPCPEQKDLVADGQRFAPGVAPFVDPSFFTGYFASSSEGPGYVAEDEETAAVAAVAAANRIPFLGIRAVSDGGGDPLGLPGFPVQFFYYRQLAADNAALTTLAVLRNLH